MKIFLDTANIDAIKKWSATGLIDGVTTNPSHLSKEGGDPKKKVLEICNLLPDGEISVEIIEKEPEAVYNQAKAIARLAPNIIVKVPCHAQYYHVIERLVQENIDLNITLVFTLFQAMAMSKLGVYMVSPIIGRLDDNDVEGIDLLFELVDMVEWYQFETQILAASMRSVRHVHKAIEAGVDIVTISPALFEQCITSSLTDAGMEKFDAEWQKLGVKQFP